MEPARAGSQAQQVAAEPPGTAIVPLDPQSVEYLPAEIVRRPKRPFATDVVDRWYRDSWSDARTHGNTRSQARQRQLRSLLRTHGFSASQAARLRLSRIFCYPGPFAEPRPNTD